MTDAIFRASYHKDVDVPSRNVRQIVLEIPSEQTQEALRILGPRGSWVAVARLEEASAERPSSQAVISAACAPSRPADGRGKPDKTPWRDMKLVTRAAILCADELFREFMNADNAADCALAIRARCEVESRKELDSDAKAAALYTQIERDFFAHKEEQSRFGP